MSPILTVITRLLQRHPRITTVQIGILLSCIGGKRTIAELAETLSQSETTISNQIRPLTQSDWNRPALLQRHIDPNDQRKLFVSLTSSGHALLAYAQEP
jgi:DNA-binding MarR family transcriptional regulator